MLLLKTFLLSAMITSTIFILIMKYIFNDHGNEFILLGIAVGGSVGSALVMLTRQKIKQNA